MNSYKKLAPNDNDVPGPKGLAPVSNLPTHQDQGCLLGSRRRKDLHQIAFRAITLSDQNVRTRREQHHGQTPERLRR